jgi:hypothetical protein
VACKCGPGLCTGSDSSGGLAREGPWGTGVYQARHARQLEGARQRLTIGRPDSELPPRRWQGTTAAVRPARGSTLRRTLKNAAESDSELNGVGARAAASEAPGDKDAGWPRRRPGPGGAPREALALPRQELQVQVEARGIGRRDSDVGRLPTPKLFGPSESGIMMPPAGAAVPTCLSASALATAARKRRRSAASLAGPGPGSPGLGGLPLAVTRQWAASWLASAEGAESPPMCHWQCCR